MRGRWTSAFAATLAAAALVGVGCGGGDDGGGGGDDALTQAKTKFVNQCHAGHEGDEKDLALCKCAADNLQRDHGYDAAKFDAATEQANKGSLPPEVIQALGPCQK